MFEALCLTLLTTCIIEATPQETATPASYLEPRNFNYHPYQVRQYLEETKPTKQGPVLFPNDGPPPPRPPLVVTSRPLAESIARSDLNPSTDNSVTPSQASPLNPAFPISSPIATFPDQRIQNVQKPASSGDVDARIPAASSYNQIPYADMLKKARLNGYLRQNGYNDYEERTVLPPIYRALSTYAGQNLLKQKPTNNNYRPPNSDYGNEYDNKVADENDNSDYDQNQNYAFSYTVRDQETGDDFSHKQESISGGTNGEYRVRLPDGRIQIVSYTADETGYKADVRYDNENDAVDNYNYAVNNNQNDQNIQNYYVNENFKEEVPIKEEANQYNSKEYYDYSSEYNQNYEPYNSKYVIYKPVSTPIVTTVRPYAVNNLVTVTPKPVLIYSDGVISASNNPPIVKYETTTERVVVIGEKKLYTNINLPETSTPAQNTFVSVTPASYLASTIASLKERIAPKAILAGNFIDKLSKYLTYK